MPSLLLERPSAVMRYLDIPGDKPPIVFIHGVGCASSSHFPETVSQAALGGHRKILVDLLGHGYSDRPEEFGYSLEDHTDTVAQLLDHLGVKQLAVFGHSMGGSIAITLAAIRPDLVSQLILAEANLKAGGGFISKVIAGQSEEQFVTEGHERLLDRLADLGFLTSVGSFRICGSRGLYRSAVGLVRATEPTMQDRLYAMTIPRAYLIGERGLPDPYTEELPRHGVEVMIIAGATHDMMFDNAAGVASAISQVLQPAARTTA